MSEEQPEHDDTSALEIRLRADLQRLVSATRPEIRAQLEAMAARAAQAGGRPARRRALDRIAWPLGSCAAAAGALALFLWAPRERPPESRTAAPDDLALLMNVDNLDLLEQMEFYQWLDRDPTLLDADAKPEGQRS